jgi:inhibitor of KinA sporulation pathway (predicted exonuclease)
MAYFIFVPIQDAVDKAPLFKEVYVSFEEWLHQNKVLGSNYSFAVVTDGRNDIQKFLQKQCQVSFREFKCDSIVILQLTITAHIFFLHFVAVYLFVFI